MESPDLWKARSLEDKVDRDTSLMGKVKDTQRSVGHPRKRKTPLALDSEDSSKNDSEDGAFERGITSPF